MGKVTVKIAGVEMSVSLKDLPALMAAVGGASTPVKKYIGQKEIKAIEAKSAEELVLKALAIQDGIHLRYSGLNDIIRDRFHVDPITVTSGLVKAGKCTLRPGKGSPVINLSK